MNTVVRLTLLLLMPLFMAFDLCFVLTFFPMFFWGEVDELPVSAYVLRKVTSG